MAALRFLAAMAKGIDWVPETLRARPPGRDAIIDPSKAPSILLPPSGLAEA
jgi:hypothetical protein